MLGFKGVISMLLLVVTVIAVWYVFLDTLMVSEIVGRDTDTLETILVTIFDFDTGLSRYDVYRLKSKETYWLELMSELSMTDDSRARSMIIAEMMQDPSMRKVIQKLLDLGAAAAVTVMSAIAI